jgi:GWxTD domain-containing protein
MRVDYATFKSTTGNRSLVEIYYSFRDSDLQYMGGLDSSVANYSIRLMLTNQLDETDTIVWAKQMFGSYDQTGVRYENVLLGTEKLTLKPGKYKTDILVSQKVKNKKDLTIPINIDSFQLEMVVPDYSLGKSFSDFQISYGIQQKEKSEVKWKAEFEKHGFYMIPLPTRQYIGTDAFLQYYYEAYLDNSDGLGKITVVDLLLDYSKFKIYDQSIDYDPMETIGRVVSIPMAGRPTGVYYIKSLIKNEKGELLASSPLKKVYLENPEIGPSQNTPFFESLSFEKSVFSTMDENDIKTEFEKLSYILSDFERGQFKQLTSHEAKQRAIYAMYSIRDTDTTTTYNEFFEEYSKRADFADQFFSYGNYDEGWRTERGRIIMTYGFPEQRQEFFRRDDLHPTEIWFYPNVQGGAEFFFVDNVGAGNFILVHSTAMNELRNPNWIQMYRPALDDLELQRYQNASRAR